MLNNIKISFFLAYKSITRGNKGRLSLTILIMTLSFLNLMFTPALLFGMAETMNQQSIDNIFGNIIIEPEEDENHIKQVSSIQKEIDVIPGVIGSSAHYLLGAIFSYDEDKSGKGVNTGSWSIKSVNVENENKTTQIHQTMVSGEYLEETDRDKIILGIEISGGYESKMKHRTLKGVETGEDVKLVFSNGVQRIYEVKGIFDAKDMQANTMAFITEKEAESILGVQDRASEIIIKIDQTGKEGRYIQEFRKIGIVDEEIKPWTDYTGMADSMLTSFNMIKVILTIIGVLVAGVTIFIIIFVNVISKKRQIGVLKAIGMKENTIIRSYVFQALVYSFSGIVLGTLLMTFLILPYFMDHPMSFPFGDVNLALSSEDMIVAGVSLTAAAIIGSLIPSMRTVKETILEAIWGS